MNKIRTYIDGFDDVLFGGIPENSTILIAGTTGTMKSALCYSIAYKNAMIGKKILYITLQQSEKDLLIQMENFGWKYEKVQSYLQIIDRRKIHEYSETVYKKTFFEVLLEHLIMIKENYNYSILVVDCLSALETISELTNPRNQMFKFFEWLKKLETTAFLISEMATDSEKYGKYEEEYLVDGIITLKMALISDTKIQRRIRCVKMRTSKHLTDWYTLLFENGTFKTVQVISEGI